MPPGTRASTAALMNLASLDGIVRGFQHLAVAIREHCVEALPDETTEGSSSSTKKCQLLLRATLNGCSRAKAAVDKALLSVDLSAEGLAFDAASYAGAAEDVSGATDDGCDTDEEAEELFDTLKMLQGQYRRHGDSLYEGPGCSGNIHISSNKDGSDSSGNSRGIDDQNTGKRDSGVFLGVEGIDARARSHAADVAALWHRHCTDPRSNVHSRSSSNRSMSHNHECYVSVGLEPCRLNEAIASGLLPHSGTGFQESSSSSCSTSSGSSSSCHSRNGDGLRAQALAACPRGHTPFSWTGDAASCQHVCPSRISSSIGDAISEMNSSSNANRRTSRFPRQIPSGHTAYSWGYTRSFEDEHHNDKNTAFLTRRKKRWSSWARLLSLLVRVRDLEASVPFRRDLLKAQMAASALMGCEQETFAFGSTPFATWAQLFDHPVHTPPLLRDALQRCRCDDYTGGDSNDNSYKFSAPFTTTTPLPQQSSQSSRRYVVFGSSIGLLAFYGAHSLGLRTTGYEILPFLAHASVDIARSVGYTNNQLRCTQKCKKCSNIGSILLGDPLNRRPDNSPGSHASLPPTDAQPSQPNEPVGNCAKSTKLSTPSQLEIVCGDMLGADLSTAAVVFLTSQCWDAPLAQKMHTKLALELPADAVVVDYTSALGRFDGSHLGWQFVPCPNNEAASSTSTFSRINDPPTHGALAKKAAEENGNGGGNGNDCDAALSGVGGSKDKKVEDDTAAALVAPVSWNPAQRFYVYQKVPCVSGDQ